MAEKLDATEGAIFDAENDFTAAYGLTALAGFLPPGVRCGAWSSRCRCVRHGALIVNAIC